MTDPLNTETLKYQINRARFVGRDFYTLLDDLLAFLRENYAGSFNDFVASDQGVMLLEVVSWAAETLAFGQDRMATESYIETARTRRAINRLARTLGYKMVPGAASTTDLDVNLAEIHAFDVPVPIGFQFQGPNDLVFEATELVTFLAGEGPLSPSRSISVREGKTVSVNFVSDGLKDQRFRLNPIVDQFVAQGTVTVSVAGVSWSEATNFLTFEKTNQFEVDYNNDPPLLKFGNGVAGNVPVTGADIAVTFVSTSGKAGRVPQDTIQDVVTNLVVAFTTIGLVINNPDPSTAGVDREDIEITRRNVPGYTAARDVAVTSPDYLSLGGSFTDPVSGAVAVAQAFITTGADSDTVLQNLLALIRTVVSALEADVLAQTTIQETQFTMITDDVADVQAESTAIAADVVTAQAALGAARTDIGTARSQQAVIQGNATAGAAAVTALAGMGPSVLAPAEEAILAGYFGGALAGANAANAALIAALGNIGLGDAALELISNSQVVIDSELVTISASLVVSENARVMIEALLSAGFEATIDGYLTDIFNHVDGFLSSVCQANLVTVQILALDNDGFYAAPSVALIRSLQLHLDARREITQVVRVVSGEDGLIYASISGVIGVLSGYVHATVKSRVQERINDLLRRRSGGVNLRISDLDKVTVPYNGVGGVEGVDYINWQITAPSSHVDSDGNLIVSQSETITRGTISLTTEAAS